MCKGKKIVWSSEEADLVAKAVVATMKKKGIDIKEVPLSTISVFVIQVQKIVLPKDRQRKSFFAYDEWGYRFVNNCYRHYGYRGCCKSKSRSKAKAKVNVNINNAQTETKPKVTDLQQLFVNMTDLLAHPTYGKAIKAMLK